MKCPGFNKCFIGILLCVFCFVSALYAQDSSEKPDYYDLDQEFKWLNAEADAKFVTVATKTKITESEAPSVVSVITGEEIRNSGAKNLEEVFRQMAGFYIFANPQRADDVVISIRGVSQMMNPGVKIMINGHSLEVPNKQNIEWVSGFPVGLIKRIEIIRGPGSALYGNAAMNGVINIITKDAKEPSEISGSFGSFDTYGGTAQLSYAKDNFSLFFFADTISTDGDPQFIEKDAASVRNQEGNAPGYTNEESDCSSFFTKLTFLKDFYFTGFYKDATREPAVGRTNYLTDENSMVLRAGFAELGYNGQISDKTALSARIYYDYSYAEFLYEMFGEKTVSSPPFSGFPETESAFMQPYTKEMKTGAELTFNLRLADSFETVAGIFYEYSDFYDTKTITNINLTGQIITSDGADYKNMQYIGGMKDVYDTLDKADRSVYAGYVQGTWNIMKTFPSFKRIGNYMTLTTGLRYDKYDDAGESINPRIGFVYSPGDRLYFKLLYGEAFRAPAFYEMYVKNNATILGNLNIEPEIIKTAEILAGISLTENISAKISFFNVRREDSIVVYRGKYDNWGKLESQGVETEITARFQKDKYAYFNLTYQNAKDISHEIITDTGGTEYEQGDYNLGMYPKLMANFGINWDVSEYVNANASVNYIGSIERIGRMRFTSDKADPDGTVEKTDKRDDTDSYALVNLSLIFHNFDFAKGWELQLTGYNIFDADRRDPEKDGNLPNDFPRWDRHFMGKITYKF